MFVENFCTIFQGALAVLTGLAAVAAALALFVAMIYMLIVLSAWIFESSKNRLRRHRRKRG